MNNTHYLSQINRAPALDVSFTAIANAHGVLTKTIDVVDDKIVKLPAANMYAGSASCLTASFEQFKVWLQDVPTSMAFCYGMYDAKYGDEVDIVIKGKENPAKRILARTQDYFQYANSPGVLMLDHDPSDYGPTITTETLLAILAEIVPGMDTAAYVVKSSTSSGVALIGETPKNNGGFHIYFPVLSAADIPRFGKVLCDRLWLAGYGYVALARNGAMLNRTIIDSAVFSPERLDFVAKPKILSERIAYHPLALIEKNGGYLDTKKLLDLTDLERENLAQTMTEAKQARSSEAAMVRKRWIGQAIEMLVADGVALEDAETTINQMIKHECTKLFGNFVLYFSDPKLGKVKVREVLKNPFQYDGAILADPVEGPGYGITTAKFYANAASGKPFINSFAHGGQQYFLYLSETSAILVTDKAGKYCSTLSNLHIALNDPEWSGFEIAKDDFLDETVYRANDGKWTRFQDHVYTKLRMHLAREKQFNEISRDNIVETIRLLAEENRFDSAKVWLDSLQWDGVERIEGFMQNYFDTGETEYSRAVSLYLWTALAGRIYHPGCQVDMFPVLWGAQGAGKSTGIKAMLPDAGMFCEVDLGRDEDDLSRLMRGKLVGEISELRGLKTRDAGTIKAFITRKTEEWVPKFREFTTRYDRRIVFIGTTNEKEFLPDDTGNRRFLPMSVGTVNREAIQRDCLQLWAEAAVRYKTDGVLWERAQELAKEEFVDYELNDPWQTIISETLTGHENYTTKEILANIIGLPVSQMNKTSEMKIAALMNKLGYVKTQHTERGQCVRRWGKL